MCRAWFALCVFCCVPGVTLAAKTQVFSTSGFEKLADGEAVSTSVLQSGTVVPAPAVTKVAALEGGPMLALTCDAKATCYAAVTSPGRVLSVDAAGKVKTLFEVEEALVTGLALDGKDGLFVATAPEGKVHRVDLKTGKADAYYAPEATHIWGLAYDGTALWVVTGEPGGLWKVTAKDKGSRVAEKPLAEKLWRAVAVLPNNKGVVVGSGRKGLLATVDPSGKAFVHYDAALEEVTSLAVRADGAVAATLVANEGKGAGDDALLTASEAGEDEDSTARDAKNSEVVVLFPNGELRRVWRGKKDAAYACAFDDKDGLYIGTGARSRLYRADLKTRDVAIVTQVDSNRITAMARGPKGIMLGLSTSNALVTVASTTVKDAVYLSPVWDAEKQVRFGRITVRGDVPAGSRMTVALRSGNTEKPDDTWSAWSAALPFPGGAAVAPRAQYAQARVTLGGDGKSTAALRELQLSWRPDNTPPTVASIDVLAPGVRVEALPSDEPKGRTFTVSARAFEDFAHKPLASPAPPEPAARAKQTFEAGWRTITWNATDEDEDELRYTAELVAENGTRVLTLGAALKDPFVALDETRLPDGVYRVRLTVDDAASNPAPDAARTEKLSDVFGVDRTPPSVTGKVTSDGKVSLTVEDQSPVIATSCGVDGGEPVAGAAVDGLLDGTREEVGVALPKPGKGRHFVACRAEDAMGNLGRLVLTLDVP